MRVPFMVEAEFRGVRPGGDYIVNGEKRERQALLKFEVLMADGDVETLELRQSQCDEAADFDVLQLRRGEMVNIDAVVYDSQYGVMVRPVMVRRKQAVGKAGAAAA